MTHADKRRPTTLFAALNVLESTPHRRESCAKAVGLGRESRKIIARHTRAQSVLDS
jgi:hypothetical protein